MGFAGISRRQFKSSRDTFHRILTKDSGTDASLFAERPFEFHAEPTGLRPRTDTFRQEMSKLLHAACRRLVEHVGAAGSFDFGVRCAPVGCDVDQ